jgi:cytochrome P450
VEPKRFRFTPRRVWWTIDRTRSLALWDEIGAAARPEGVLQFRFAGDRIWVLTDPRWCRQALTAPPAQIARSSTFSRISIFIGHSLLTTDGVQHRLRRRQMQPAFTRERLQGYATSMVAAAERTSRNWWAGRRVAMEREMAALTLDAIGQAVLGVDGRAVAPEIAPALDRLMKATTLLLVPGLERVVLKPVPGFGWLREANRVLDRAAWEAASGSRAELVASLRSPSDDSPPLSAQAIRDELLTLLLAGHETTAMLLTWTWWLLDRHPDAAERIRVELASVVGDRTPDYDDVARLHYLQSIVAEVLRLRPPAWMLERQVNGAVEFDGRRPDPGTLLLISPGLLHRDPRWWGDPDRFRPERWLDADGRYDEDAPGQPRGAYLPFGAGAHVCIGSGFAWIEAVLALAVLIPRWRPRLAGAPAVRTRAAITLRPADELPMVLEAASR